MSSFRFTKVEISNPILQRATSSRVSPSFKEGTVYSSTGDLIKQQEEKSQALNQIQGPTTEEEGVQKLQTKYASPDNLLVPNMNTLSIANIEADAVRTTNGSVSAFSDTSSDVSDITTSVPSAGSGSAYVLPVVEGISEEDINQVDMFYRSHKTEVRVCRSLANLYVSVPKIQDRSTAAQPPPSNKKDKRSKSSSSENQGPKSPDPSDFSKDEWEFSKTGIPVLVLDSGDHLRERRLSIILAEKGTGFTLWQDQFNHFTKYSTPHTNFHTITLSTDSTRLVGFSFDEGNAATEFADAVKSLTANPDDDLLNLSKKKKKKDKKPKQKYKPPKKVDISQPVCFVHVTKLERPDLVSGIFPPPPSGAELDRLGIPRAMSESSGISECSTTPSEH